MSGYRLLQFLPPETIAELPQERLLRWAAAYEDWVAERKANCHPSTYKISFRVWRRLLAHCQKPPWQINTADIQAYLDGKSAKGHRPSSIRSEQRVIARFYSWSAKRGIDPETGADFNPARAVFIPPVRPLANAQVLSVAEARALLDVFLLEGSILSLRDYALYLTRLRTGPPLQQVLQLRWSQIDPGDPLPADVLQAIRTYLEVAGRLPHMRPESYIFAPLADPLRQPARGAASDWDDTRYLCTYHVGRILKKYGRLAGIPESKLTLFNLRHTAASLRLQAGDDPAQMQAFLHKRSRKTTMNYLCDLAKRRDHSETDPADLAASLDQIDFPPQQRFKSFIHGMYAAEQPPAELAAILAEDIRGLDEEFAGLRFVERCLVVALDQACSAPQAARLNDCLTRTAARLSSLVEAERGLEKRLQGKARLGEEAWVERALQALDAFNASQGLPPASAALQEELEREGGAHLELSARRLTEEVAATRLSLRRTLALIAKKPADLDRLLTLADVYSTGCGRLTRILVAQPEESSRKADILSKAIRTALDQAIVELELTD